MTCWWDDEGAMPRILLTNDDGWDAPGLAALKLLASELGEATVLAPREPHSYAGHRVTTDRPLQIAETGPAEWALTGTPADCVRVGLTEVACGTEWVIAGINRGGNLGADLFTSGTVAAAREAALLGRPAIAISQFIRKGVALDWERSRELALPLLRALMARGCAAGHYWNVNLPHLLPGEQAEVAECAPDNLPLDVRYRRDGDLLHYAGSYPGRARTPGKDVDLCFGGAITVSMLNL
jgi:5'-nucleotidase